MSNVRLSHDIFYLVRLIQRSSRPETKTTLFTSVRVPETRLNNAIDMPKRSSLRVKQSCILRKDRFKTTHLIKMLRVMT